jgi:hypothetical protein
MPHPLTGQSPSSTYAYLLQIYQGVTSTLKAIEDGLGNATALSLSTTAAQVAGALSATTLAGDGSALTNLNAGNIAAGTLPISRGGTGQVTAAAALAALLPSQTGQSGKVLGTDGTATSWVSPGSTGTVTSVGLSLPSIITVSGSPVTTSGTLTGTLATQAANTCWAGPTSGAAAAPTFRSLVLADLPSGVALTGSANTFTTGPQVFVGGETVRQTGGTAGTNEAQITHDGTDYINASKNGGWTFTSSTNFSMFTITVRDKTYSFADGFGSGFICGSQMMIQGELRTGSGQTIGWSSSSTPTSAVQDIGFKRNSAGVVQVTNGSSGFGTLYAGGLATQLVSKTSAYTMTATDGVVVADVTGGSFTLTLPAANAVVGGRRYTVKRSDSSINSLTLAAAGSDTIDGVGTKAISTGASVEVVSDGTSKWYIIG